MNALHIASTAMMAQQLGIEVIASNTANINTNGYKKKRAEFTDLIYRQIHKDPIPKHKYTDKKSYETASNIQNIVEIGSGARLNAVRDILLQGSIDKTGNQLDVAINGKGYFVTYDLKNGDIGYTRDGSFKINKNRELVTHDNNIILNIDAIKGDKSLNDQENQNNILDFNKIQNSKFIIPENTVRIDINKNGEVFSIDRNSQSEKLGTLALAVFANEGGLKSISNNKYMETIDSGKPNIINPNMNSNFSGEIVQGAVEASNVDPVSEITHLIKMQRVYEFCSKIINATDEMMKKVTNVNG